MYFMEWGHGLESWSGSLELWSEILNETENSILMVNFVSRRTYPIELAHILC